MTNSQIPPNTDTPKWVKIFGITVVILFLGFVILHLSGGGFKGHSSMQHETAVP